MTGPLNCQTSWLKVVGEGSGSNSVKPQSLSSHPRQECALVSFLEWTGQRPSKPRAQGWGPCHGLASREDTRLRLRQTSDSSRFPGDSRVPVTLSGVGRMRDQEPQESRANRSVPRALRFRSGPRPPPPSASPAACISSGTPVCGPPRAPRPLLGLAAALRSVRRSAGSSFGSSSGPARAPAPARMPWRSGWAGASQPLRLGLLCVQGRGAPAGPGRTDPRPRSAGKQPPAVSWALPCPALPCSRNSSPARPSVAVPAPPLVPPSPSWALLGGGAAPRSQLGGATARVIAEMGTRRRWERRAAPLCAQPARHPHSVGQRAGGRAGQGGGEAEGCREAGTPGGLVKGGQTDTCREG